MQPAGRIIASSVLGKSLLASTISKPPALRAVLLTVHRNGLGNYQRRNFSFTSIKRTEPSKSATSVETFTEPAWPHPVYTKEEMDSIAIAHRDAKNWSDYIALGLVKTVRGCFDIATGYSHDKEVARGTKAGKAWQPFKMTERKWLIRSIFLESIAGVPGMVGGMVRHLQSLRKMKRDNGWIETLLEEAYNERMHLLTFLRMWEPGWFMRAMILGAQGVFFNAFFVGYLLSPRTAHRFVGYLEEEAVITYTRIIADLKADKLPQWKHQLAPAIAVQYWKMPENSTIEDMMYYIRADEAKHREVNHTLANLSQKEDPNPFVTTYEDTSVPRPSKGIAVKGAGWEREECISK